jgi:leucyl-tRNA synthetase
VHRFLHRTWRAIAGRIDNFDPTWRESIGQVRSDAASVLRRKTHQTVRRVSHDIQRWHFNTAISAMMELVNAMTDIGDGEPPGDMAVAYSEACELLTLLLAPYAPHVAEELWSRLGNGDSVHAAAWPKWDEAAAQDEAITVVVQVNGKLRDRLAIPPGVSKKDLEARALDSPRVRAHVEGRTVRRIIVVPDRLVNIVTG